MHPIEMSKMVKPIWDPKHPAGLLFEYEGAALPQLKYLAEKSPKTKITVVDTSKYIINNYDSNNLINDNHEIFIFTATTEDSWYNAIRCISTNLHLDQDTQNIKKKKIGIIIGADKPKLCVINNKLYFYFISFGRSMPVTSPNLNDRFKQVLFFWDKNFPLIPIKQSHIVKTFLEKNKEYLNFFIGNNTERQINLRMKFHESNIMKRLIYPNWNTGLYQKNKFPQTVPPKLIFGNRGEEVITEQFNHIREKYKPINNYASATIARSKFYLIGDINQNRDIYHE